MTTTTLDRPVAASGALWAGRILSGFAVALLGLDAVMKLALPQTMIEHSPPLGLPADPGQYRLLGGILLAALVLHCVPRTRFVGALLVTAFLGGAVAVNLRAEMPVVGNTLFGVYLGVLFWLGYHLRDAKLRTLVA